MSIQARDLCVHYGDHCALHHLDLSVERGELVGVVGPNGGGKTTLLRALLGLIPSANGLLEIGGRVAYVAQDSRTASDVPISVLEFTTLGRLDRRFLRRRKAADRERVQEALQEVGMWEHRHRRLSTLSGGQRQRVHLANALCQDAEILLLDEPTTGIDPRNRDEIYQLLAHLAHEHRITIVLVSHDTETVARIADRIIVVDRTKQFEGDGEAFRTWSAGQAKLPTDNPFGAHP